MNRLIVLIFCVACFYSPLKGDIPSSERAALIDLYQTLNNPTLYASWLDEAGQFRPPGTEGSWRGVRTTNENTYVIHLNFSVETSLTLPDSISNFVHLISFSFTGAGDSRLTFPASFWELQGLRTLYLDNCLAGKAPDELWGMGQLEHLYIRNSNLVGDIPDDIYYLKSLYLLDLLGNQLTTLNQFNWDELPRLAVLNIRNNQFSMEIGELESVLNNIVYLDASQNDFSGILPGSFWNFPELRSLKLQENQIQGTIDASIGNLVQLQTLDLSNNSLEGTLPGELFLHENLYHLNLSNNQFSGSIPETLGSSSMLSFLDLSHNQLEGRVPDGLCNLNHIYSLSLNHNYLTDLPSCFHGFYNSSYFHEINLSYNYFDDGICAGFGALSYNSSDPSYKVQRDRIILCEKSELAAIFPWIPANLEQWETKMSFSSLNDYTPTGELFFMRYGSDGSLQIPTGRYDNRFGVGWGSSYRTVEAEDACKGYTALLLNESSNISTRIQTQIVSQEEPRDFGVAHGVPHDALSNELVFPGFSSRVDSALTLVAPFHDGPLALTCEILTENGLLAQVPLQLEHNRPLGQMNEILFSQVILPETYALHVKTQDDIQFTGMAYSFYPGRGIGMSNAVPIHHASSRKAIFPGIWNTDHIQSTLFFTNPGDGPVSIELYAKGESGAGIKNVISLGPKSSMSLSSEQIFPGLTHYYLLVQTMNAEDRIFSQLQVTNSAEQLVGQTLPVALDHLTDVSLPGLLSGTQQAILDLCLPKATTPADVLFVLINSSSYRDTFYKRKLLKNQQAHTFDIYELFEELLPEDLLNESADQNYTLAVFSMEGEAIASCLTYYEPGQYLAISQSTAFEYVDLLIPEWTVTSHCSGSTQLEFSVYNQGNTVSPSGTPVALFDYNSAEIIKTLTTLEPIAPGEKQEFTFMIDFPANDSYRLRIDPAFQGWDSNIFNNEVSINLKNPVFMNTSSFGFRWPHPKKLSFADDNAFSIRLSTQDLSCDSDIHFFAKQLVIQEPEPHDSPEVSLQYEWTPNDLLFDFDRETQILFVSGMDENRVYQIGVEVQLSGGGTMVLPDLFWLTQSAYSRQEFESHSIQNANETTNLKLFNPFFNGNYLSNEATYQNTASYHSADKPNVSLNAALKAIELGFKIGDFEEAILEIPDGFYVSSHYLEDLESVRPQLRVVGSGVGRCFLGGVKSASSKKTSSALPRLLIEGLGEIEISDLSIWGMDPTGMTIPEVSGEFQDSANHYRYQFNPLGIVLKDCQKVNLHNLDIRYCSVGISLEKCGLPESTNNKGETQKPFTAATNISNTTISYGFQGLSMWNQHSLSWSGENSSIYHMSTQGILISDQSKDLVIQDLQIQGARHRGINIDRSSHIALIDNIISDSGFTGIHLGGGNSTCLIKGNRIINVSRDIENDFNDSDLIHSNGIFPYRPLYEGIKMVHGGIGPTDSIWIIGNQVQGVGDGISISQGMASRVLVEDNEVSARRRALRLEYGITCSMIGMDSTTYPSILNQVYIAETNSFSLEEDSSTINDEGYDLFFPCSEQNCSDCNLENLSSFGEDLHMRIAFYVFPFNFYSSEDCLDHSCDADCRVWIDNRNFEHTGQVFLSGWNSTDYIQEGSNAQVIDDTSVNQMDLLRMQLQESLEHLVPTEAWICE